MKNKKLKIEDYISSLDRNDLDNEQQALLLASGESFMGSDSNQDCTNVIYCVAENKGQCTNYVYCG